MTWGTSGKMSSSSYFVAHINIKFLPICLQVVLTGKTDKWRMKVDKNNKQFVVTCKQQMRSGMWAMMTLLDVLDCSFSDSLVQRFSAPGVENIDFQRWLLRRVTSCVDGLISHPALQSRPTPWGPHRRRWPGSAVWAGSAHSGGTRRRAGSSAAPTGCCWTAPARSHEPPSQSLSEGLENTRSTLVLLQ